MQSNDRDQKSQVRIGKAKRSDSDTLIRLAARAYDKEPFANWVVHHDEKRNRSIKKFFELYFRDYGMKYDHVFTTDKARFGLKEGP